MVPVSGFLVFTLVLALVALWLAAALLFLLRRKKRSCGSCGGCGGCGGSCAACPHCKK